MKNKIYVSLYALIGFYSTFAVQEKPIVIIIPSFNNASCYEKNLDSVFAQKYGNWRAIYIDDVSTDGTGDLVERYVKAHKFEDRFIIIKNKHRSLAMANLYRAIHSCHDDEIIATLDGDDWFAHENVLTVLNEAYQNPDVWLTYGSYIDWPEPEQHVYDYWMSTFGGFGNRAIPEDVIRTNSFRSFIGCTGQLRTCYAWLFKQIKLEDFMYQSDFLPMTYDVAMMVPLHELAGGRFKYIPDILYIHNLDTPLNDHKVDAKLQSGLERLLRNKPKYQPLASKRSGCFDACKQARADLVIFSYDRPLQLYALLESVDKYVTGISSISVICRSSTDQYRKAFAQVNKVFPHVRFFKQNGPHDFKSVSMQIIKRGLSDHIIFAVDDNIVKDQVNVSECIEWLEKTQAYGFYLKLGTHLNFCYTENKKQKVPTHTQIYNDIYAYQFEYGECDWNYPNTVDMTLYRKKDLIDIFQTLEYTNPNWLEGRWAAQWIRHKSPHAVGLFYESSKIVNIPLNRVQNEALNLSMNLYSPEQLLEKFQQGLKIDSTPLYRMKNNAVHTVYEPTFVRR